MVDEQDLGERAEVAASTIDDPMIRCIAVTYWAKGYSEAMRDIVKYQQGQGSNRNERKRTD